MFKRIEPAKSKKSFCSRCWKRIEKGELRFVEEYKYGFWKKIRFYCQKCGLKLADILDKKIFKLE